MLTIMPQLSTDITHEETRILTTNKHCFCTQLQTNNPHSGRSWITKDENHLLMLQFLVASHRSFSMTWEVVYMAEAVALQAFFRRS